MVGAEIDTGTLLEVPPSEQLEVDNPEFEDANEDEYFDVSDVPDGEIVVLSTASLDEEE